MRIAAQIISIIFHPLLIIIYLLMILLALNPYLFALSDLHEKTTFFVYTFVNTLVIPVLAILVMKLLGMVNSLEMHSSKERIGPLIVIGSLYLWMFINYKGNPSIPEIFSAFILGSVLGVFISFFINNFTKISLHMLGMGGLLAALILMKYHLQYDSFFFEVFDLFGVLISLDFLIILSILLTGLIASARLYLKAHSTNQLLLGFITGLLTQLMGYSIIF